MCPKYWQRRSRCETADGVDVVGDDDDVAGNNLAPPDLGLAPEVAKFSDKAVMI